MYKYDPCECCGHDINAADDPARIERMARFIAKNTHSGVDFWDGKSGGEYSGEYDEREKEHYRYLAKRFLNVADGINPDEEE